MSFDSKCHQLKSLKVCLNPFRSGQCLSTEDIIMSSLKSRFVSIPFDQGNVFRLQTLSFRAVFVSIPFDQGNVFRPNGVSSVIDLFVSIPFDQGNVFRLRVAILTWWVKVCLNPFRSGQCLSTMIWLILVPAAIGLNPFRSGQCLSTTYNERSCNFNRVSIPFDQGNVFRRSKSQERR